MRTVTTKVAIGVVAVALLAGCGGTGKPTAGATPAPAAGSTPAPSGGSTPAPTVAAKPGDVVAQYNGTVMGYLNGRLITETKNGFSITDTNFKIQASGDLLKANNLVEISKVMAAADGSAAYLMGTVKGIGKAPGTNVLGRIGDDGKFLWKVPAKVTGTENKVGFATDYLMYADADTLLVAVRDISWDDMRDQRVTGYRAKDGKVLYKDSRPGAPAGTVGTNYYRSSPWGSGMNYTYQGYNTQTGKKVGGALKNDPVTHPASADHGKNISGVFMIPRYGFSNGDSLLNSDFARVQVRAVARVGKIKWSVGSVKLPTELQSSNEHRVLVKGPSGDLVVLDALTGKQVGDPIPTTGKAFAGCGVNSESVGMLTDTLVALNCGDKGYLVALP